MEALNSSKKEVSKQVQVITTHTALGSFVDVYVNGRIRWTKACTNYDQVLAVQDKVNSLVQALIRGN